MKMIETELSKKRKAPYTPGVVDNGTLYVSGQLPLDPETGSVVTGDVRNHARQALLNVGAVLSAAGCKKEDVLQCRIYTPDVAYWDDINIEYTAFFGTHKPARVVVPTGPLHYGSLVEIEAVASCKGEE